MAKGAVLAGIVLLGLLSAGSARSASSAGAQGYAPGEKLALANCGRCHVVNDRNRMGGIGSTPSFAILRSRSDWEKRMKSFWTRRPHISFTQIEGVTHPFPINRPPPIHPITLTRHQVDQIVDYMRSLKPADLGKKMRTR